MSDKVPKGWKKVKLGKVTKFKKVKKIRRVEHDRGGYWEIVE
jgi:hypothetical protein